MSAGVFRPYTLVDVLGTMNQQIGDLSGSQSVTGFGDVADVEESMASNDAVTGSTVVASTATWDNATWGTFIWT